MPKPCLRLVEDGESNNNNTFGSSLQRQLVSLQQTLLRSHEQVLADLQQRNLELQQELELLRGQLSESKSAPPPGKRAEMSLQPVSSRSPSQLSESKSARVGPRTSDTQKLEQEAETLKTAVEHMLEVEVEETGSDVTRQVVDTAKLPALARWTFLVAEAIHPHRVKRSKSLLVPEEESRYRLYEEWTILSRSKSREKKARLHNLEDGDTRTGDFLRDDSECLQPYISTPSCKPRILWGALGAAYLMWDIWTIPLMAFDMPSELADTIGTMSYITFAYWALDLPSQFFVGFEYKGVLEMRPSVIAKNYMTSWMALDVIILSMESFMFTMDYIFDGSSSSNPLMTVRLGRMLRLLRFARLLRLRKLTDVINIMFARLRSEFWVLVLKFCRLTAYIIITNHYVACSFFLIGTLSGEEVNWITVARIDHAGMGTQYLTAYHWALTQFCPATNNIGPVNGFERGFAIILVLYAFIVFSSFVSAVTNASNQLRAVKMDRIRQDNMMHQFIADKQVSTDLWCRIQAYIMSRGLNDRIMIKERDIPLFLEIPENMRLQLHIELYMPIVTRAPFMIAGASLDNEVLIKLAHNVIDESHVQARKDVFVTGSVCSHCYFTRSGNMLYYSDLIDTGAVPVQKDQWLSEVVLWSPWKHSGHLLTQTFTEFILLDADKFVNIVMQEGGQMYVYLRMLGLVLLASMDASDDSGEFCTDLGVGRKSMNQLAERSLRFAELEKRDRRISFGGDIMTEFDDHLRRATAGQNQ